MNRPYYVLISSNEGIMGISQDVESLFAYADANFHEYLIRECITEGNVISPTGPVVHRQKIEEKVVDMGE